MDANFKFTLAVFLISFVLWTFVGVKVLDKSASEDIPVFFGAVLMLTLFTETLCWGIRLLFI
jgi:hypothetical protein